MYGNEMLTENMLTEEEGMERYDDMLDECFSAVRIGESTFYPSTVLKECDPAAYRTGFSDYADTLALEGTPVEGYI
jgi:hypothetical protein